MPSSFAAVSLISTVEESAWPDEKKFLPFSFKSFLPKSYWITRLYLASFWRPLAAQMLVVAQR